MKCIDIEEICPIFELLFTAATAPIDLTHLFVQSIYINMYNDLVVLVFYNC